MNRLSYFESIVVGFLVGVTGATYLVFVMSSKGFLGVWISSLFLKPLLDMFDHLHNGSLLVAFIFFVSVCILYSVLVNYVLRKTSVLGKVIFITFLVSVIGITLYDQVVGSRHHKVITPDEMISVVLPQQKKTVPEQYFGAEDAYGDLNSDEKNDVVFLIPRIQKEREPLYYLTGSLNSGRGYEGLNLIFLGSNVDPKGISVENGLVSIEYKDRSLSKDAQNKMFYVKLIDEHLYQVRLVSGVQGTTTEVVLDN